MKQREKIASQVEEAGITDPKNLEEQAISLVGTDIYEKLIKGYTEKQWGRDCKDLPSFIIKSTSCKYILMITTTSMLSTREFLSVDIQRWLKICLRVSR